MPRVLSGGQGNTKMPKVSSGGSRDPRIKGKFRKSAYFIERRARVPRIKEKCFNILTREVFNRPSEDKSVAQEGSGPID